jgi:hypothetical protein
MQMQAEMIRRLVGMLEGGAGHGIDGIMTIGMEAGKEIGAADVAKGKGKERDSSSNGHAS